MQEKGKTISRGEWVSVTSKQRVLYVGRKGTIEKVDQREGKPYVGVKFAGTEHIVWFFEEELA